MGKNYGSHSYAMFNTLITERLYTQHVPGPMNHYWFYTFLCSPYSLVHGEMVGSAELHWLSVVFPE